jgi:hypothetical protein
MPGEASLLLRGLYRDQVSDGPNHATNREIVRQHRAGVQLAQPQLADGRFCFSPRLIPLRTRVTFSFLAMV